jgi:glycosyltransferase involved in cell wall biosynthesis
MHILIITPGFPKDEKETDCIPPMQEFFEEMMDNHNNIKVSVIAIHYPERKINYEWKRLRVYAIGGKRRSQPIRSIYWLAAIWKAININSRNKIDIVHSFWLNESALIGQIISRLLGIRHINTIMGQDAKQNNKYLKLLPLRRITKAAVSEFQAGVFKQSANCDVDAVIPWGIKSFAVKDCERDIDIIGVGSLIEIKNFDAFIDVVRELKNEFLRIKCVILGEGYLRNRLMHKINSYNLQDNISLLGQVPREEVLSYMNRSKILLHTSDYESFGYVLEEALAAGCYVVSREVGCANESDKFFTAESNDDFAKMAGNVLCRDKEYSPRILFPVRETVRSYVDLYEKFLCKDAKTQNYKVVVNNS